jgi:hypothetical protein
MHKNMHKHMHTHTHMHTHMHTRMHTRMHMHMHTHMHTHMTGIGELADAESKLKKGDLVAARSHLNQARKNFQSCGLGFRV